MYRGWKPRVVVVVFVVLIVFMIISISCSSFFFYEFRPSENHIHPLLTVTYNVSLPTDFLTYSVMCKQPPAASYHDIWETPRRDFEGVFWIFTKVIFGYVYNLPLSKTTFCNEHEVCIFLNTLDLDAISFFFLPFFWQIWCTRSKRDYYFSHLKAGTDWK